MKPRIRYAIHCPACIRLGREQTVHLMGHPRARGCAEHRNQLQTERWRERHPTRHQKCCRDYHRRHRDERLAYRRDYCAKNREAVRATNKAWRDRHRDVRSAYSREWRQRSHLTPADEPIRREIQRMAIV